MYAFQIVFGVIGVGVYLYVLWLYKRGNVIEYGKLEVKQELQQSSSPS